MQSQRYEISQQQSVQVLSLALPDVMDGMEIDALIESVLRALEGKSRQPWVMDLNDVQYMGSAMLGLMVNVRQRILQGGGKLVLCGMSQQLLHIFQTCCLERLFTIAKTRPDALAMATRS
ncbi:MAG: STAS domain-containing protein [Tepidisphaeraceae bacterium]|jgi:anti-anti-sigma factor